MPRLFIVFVCLIGVSAGTSAAPPAERRATIFYTGGIHGTLEPCGCTSDPLGDVARMTGVVRRARQERAGAVLVVDAGNLSYPATEVPARRREATDLRAAFLAAELPKLPFAGSALGESDLSRGPGQVKPPRLAANRKAPFTTPSRLEEVGGIKVGVFGLADPAVAAAGFQVEDPAAGGGQPEPARGRGGGGAGAARASPGPPDRPRRRRRPGGPGQERRGRPAPGRGG